MKRKHNNLGTMLSLYCASTNRSLRDVAKEMGASTSTLSRCSSGDGTMEMASFFTFLGMAIEMAERKEMKLCAEES